MSISISPPYSLCFPPKTKQQQKHDRMIYENYDRQVSMLPKSIQPPHMHLSLYKGFWLPNGDSFGLKVLQGTMAAQDHFASQPDDILLATLPKVGTTWLKALAFATLNRTDRPFPQSNLLSLSPHECVPFLEYQLYSNDRIPNMDFFPSPRLLATHVPYSLLPRSVSDPHTGSRIVYLCRNPRDTFTSMWKFVGTLIPETSIDDLEEALEAFVSGVYTSGPYWDHVLEYWRASQGNPNKVLFMRFEDLKRDPEGGLRRLAEFMGCPFTLEEEKEGVVEKILGLCSLKNLKNLEVNRAKNTPFWSIGFDNRSFFGKGEVGDWANYLTPQMVEKFDKVMEDKFRDSGLSFEEF